MNEVHLISRTVTIEAFSACTSRRAISTAGYRAVSRNGLGPRTEHQAMYNSKGPIPIVLSYYNADDTTKVWLIQSFNVDPTGGPNFSIDYPIDISTKDNVVFVVTHQ